MKRLFLTLAATLVLGTAFSQTYMVLDKEEYVKITTFEVTKVKGDKAFVEGFTKGTVISQSIKVGDILVIPLLSGKYKNIDERKVKKVFKSRVGYNEYLKTLKRNSYKVTAI